jgi:acyl carrier protein
VTDAATTDDPVLAAELAALIRDDVGTRPGEPVDEGTDLLLDGVVDSLGVFRIVQWLEERTGVAVEPVDVTLENFQTVAAIVRFVESRRVAPSR